MPDSSVTQFSSISVTKLDDPVIRALTWGLRKPSSCFHCATSFLCESHWAVLSQGVGPEGAEECSAFVLNLRIDHLTWVPTSTWHSGAFFVVFKYFWLCLDFLSARLQWESSLGTHRAHVEAPLSCLLLHPPILGSQMDLKAQICSLLSMVLVLASYQSVFYYKMLTHSFYMYFKLWGRKKEGAGVDTFFTALWVYGRALRGKKINPRS